MKNSFMIAKVKNIRIEVNISWFLIFGLLTYSLATSYFPYVYEGLDAASRWILGGIMAIMLFVSVLLHELSHSLVSIRQGIPVKSITLFVFGGVAQIEKEPDKPAKEFKIAVAGPLMSIFLFLFFMALAQLLNFSGAPEAVIIAVSYLSGANLMLAIFNLIPAFPLDGGRILRSVIWHFSGDGQKATKISSFTGSVFGYVLISLGVFLILGNDLISGAWLAFIGWFITQQSKAGYQSKVMSDVFGSIRVGAFMTTSVISVDYNLSVQELIDHYFYKYKFVAFPVKREGKIIGIIRAENIKDVPAESRTRIPVANMTVKLTDNLVVSQEDTVSDAMTKIFSNGIGRVLVMDQEKNLLGIVSNTDILKYLRAYNQLNP